MIYASFLLLTAAYYAALMVTFAVGFKRVRQKQTCKSMAHPYPFVSIVIAARNEEDNIAACLVSVFSNTYPEDRFEVVIVDDFSEDATAARVREVQYRYNRVPAGDLEAETPRLRLLQMDEKAASATGYKRDALDAGIAHARGDLLLTTDADCTVPHTWIETMVAYFTHETGFVAGPVCYRPDRTFFGKAQALEFLGFFGVGAGSIGIGYPTICSSANVAYRRAVYDAFMTRPASDYASPAADEELAQRVAADGRWRVRACIEPDAAVVTEPELDLRAFWAQRVRWAATGARFPGLLMSAMLLGIYIFYVLLLGGLLVVPLVPALLLPLLGGLSIKVLAEALVLVPVCRHFGDANLLWYFIPAQILQIPYIVFVSAAGVLGATQWKGRPLAPAPGIF